METTNILEQVSESTSSLVFGVWFLIGAALVFFMQAGCRLSRESDAELDYYIRVFVYRLVWN